MNMLFSEAIGVLLPTLLQIISAVLGVLLIRATAVAKARWGIEIEARHREALQTSIMSGIRAALTRGLTGEAAVQAAISHATRSTADALDHFKPLPDVLESIARAKLEEATKPGPVIALSNSDDVTAGDGRSPKGLRR
ncbi:MULTISPECIES: hypothetical protein [unclassified Marinovum]|uniref:hypothetical protein n=1 Tax=unclassified Marinovum TaxID=2647166 RepID=UPI003EDBC6E9